MHFAYPPRKSSDPPPFRPAAQLRVPSLLPILRRSRLRAVALFGLAVIGLMWLLSGGSDGTSAYKSLRNPSGTPKVVIVTVLEGKGYGQDYTQSLKENRERYAKLHGYEVFITTPHNYSLKGSPPSWTKVVAMRHALTRFPDCQYVWYLDQTAFIMNPAKRLERDVMADAVLDEAMIRDWPVVPPDSIIKTFSHLQASEVQFVLTMDKVGMTPMSLVLRNGDWVEFFLDTWFDPIYRSYNFQKAEVHALEHIVQWHPTILSKLAIIPQRSINSYASTELGELYDEGDYVIRFPKCDPKGEKSCSRQSRAFTDRWKVAFDAAGA